MSGESLTGRVCFYAQTCEEVCQSDDWWRWDQFQDLLISYGDSRMSNIMVRLNFSFKNFKAAPKLGQSPCTIAQCVWPNFAKNEKERIFIFYNLFLYNVLRYYYLSINLHYLTQH